MTKIRSTSTACALCAVLFLVAGCAQDGNAQAAEAPPPPAMGTAGAAAAAPQDQGAASPNAAAPTTMTMVPSAPPDQPMAPAPQSSDAPADDPEPMHEPEPLWEPLITAKWELAPGEERYFCQRVTLTEDIYFGAIRAINPLGTHHTALTAEPSEALEPDGLTECGSALSPQGIFGSGPGTDPVFYPPSVGLRLRAGQQVLLNVHVFNVSEEPLSGTSGTEVVRTTPDKVEHIAESLLAGPVFLDLPAHQETTVTGTCTMMQDTTLFAVQPHMHQLGVHMKGVAESSVLGTVVLHDGPFDFDKQLVYSIDPVPMREGDVVRVECTFDNTTDESVGLGESSTAEMCFMVLHRYPAPDDPSVTCFF